MTTTQTPPAPAGFVASNLPNYDWFVASTVAKAAPVSTPEQIAEFEAIAAAARTWLAEQATYMAPADVTRTYVATHPEAAAITQTPKP